MTTQVDQEYIDDPTDRLSYFIEEAGRQLNQYVKGDASEEDIQTVTERAVETYEELEDRIDEATQQLKERDVFEEFKDEVHDAGYSNVSDFMHGRNPINASGENPQNQVMSNFTETDYIDTSEAHEVMGDYTNLARDLAEHYEVEISLPELGEEGQQIVDKMEEMEDLMDEEDMSAEEALDEVDFF